MNEPWTVQNLRRVPEDLIIEDLSLQKILKAVPAPFYLYSETALARNLEDYRKYFSCPEFETQVFYASKAFNIRAMLELVNSLGLGVDVVSAGELYTALSCHFKPENILVHGNNKSDEELAMALENGVGTIVADNLMEARRLARIAETIPSGKKTDVLLRINPGIEAHTHKYIVTGHVDSKFGVSVLDIPEIIEIEKTVDACPSLSFRGFHAHIGSQITDLEAFRQEIAKLAGFCLDYQQAGGKDISVLDFGGGFAAWYAEDSTPPSIEKVCTLLIDAAREYLLQSGLHVRKLYIEPGRSVVANAAISVHTIGDRKVTPNKKYYFINGGMTDNIRPALYQADYSVMVLEGDDNGEKEPVTIAGKCCESGDILVEGALLPEAKSGDHLVTFSTGAYGYSMASNYNKIPVPGVYFVKGDTLRQVVRPQSLEQLIENEESQTIDL